LGQHSCCCIAQPAARPKFSGKAFDLGIFFWKQGNPKKAKFHLQRAAQTIKSSEKLSKINEILDKFNKKSRDDENGKKG